jgi:arylsulfatase A-like enzyme
VLGAAAIAAAARSVDRMTSKPNILFICLDDLNAWVGHLGTHPDVLTPNIDALAERGISFSRAYCAAPYCNASRMAVFTGSLPHHSGIYHDEPLEEVAPQLRTLPELLRAAGYHTACSGKVFHGVYGYADANRARAPHATWRAVSCRERYWNTRRVPDPEPLPPGRPLNGLFDPGRFGEMPGMYQHFDWGPLPDESFERLPDVMALRAAQRFLEAPPASPFLYCLGIYKPHLPWYAPARFFAPYDKPYVWLPPVRERDLDDVPEIARAWALSPRDHELVVSRGVWREAVAGYLACISYADHLVGELLDTLSRSTVRDETAVLLWSDNGFHLGEKLHWRKFVLWEEATRVPLVLLPAGGRATGTLSPHPVSLVDVFSTTLELAGLGAESADGSSLVAAMGGADVPADRPVLSVWGRGNHSVRLGDWRLTVYHDGTTELYDHRVDRNEWRNLSDHPGHAQMKSTLMTVLSRLR